jgi:hypothetical protein
MGCAACGWRLYGGDEIENYVLSYNQELVEQKELEALEAERERRRERDRRYRERKRQDRFDALRKKKEEEKVHPLPTTVPGYPFSVGELDPVLRVEWAAPVHPGELASCAWPPCEGRRRTNSKYCSRECTVKVAHRRDKLRKAGKLFEQKAAS